jgi:hypothetical protein
MLGLGGGGACARERERARHLHVSHGAQGQLAQSAVEAVAQRPRAGAAGLHDQIEAAAAVGLLEPHALARLVALGLGIRHRQRRQLARHGGPSVIPRAARGIKNHQKRAVFPCRILWQTIWDGAPEVQYWRGFLSTGESGNCRVLSVAVGAPDVFTHHVDVSWNESWTGTEQKRIARFEDNRVYLSTPPSLDPITGTTSVRTMTWEKLG